MSIITVTLTLMLSFKSNQITEIKSSCLENEREPPISNDNSVKSSRLDESSMAPVQR